MFTEYADYPGIDNSRSRLQAEAYGNIKPSGGGRQWPVTTDGLSYGLLIPGRFIHKTPLVLVHGISRNAGQHMDAFASWAEQQGRLLIVPLFAKKQARHYQSAWSKSCRADRLLKNVLQDAQQRSGYPFKQIDLFGFSGGAQFSHRFALLYPQRVRRLSLASAGWYTLPDQQKRFPYGISAVNRRGRLIQRRFNDFLQIPIQVLVGESDTARDSSLRQSSQLDLQQGQNRLERAGNWLDAIKHHAQQRELSATTQFQLLPGCGHSFQECVERGHLVQRVTTWFGDGVSTCLS